MTRGHAHHNETLEVRLQNLRLQLDDIEDGITGIKDGLLKILTDPEPIRCQNCDRLLPVGQAIRTDWHALWEEDGELVGICPECLPEPSADNHSDESAICSECGLTIDVLADALRQGWAFSPQVTNWSQGFSGICPRCFGDWKIMETKRECGPRTLF